MDIKVNRKIFTDKSTIGVLSVNGSKFCYTIEDKDRKLEAGGAKVPSATAIPRGKYHVIVTFSNRFKKYLPLVLNVPGFDGIRIHPGNTSEDTEGCILVGDQYGDDVVLNSRATFNKLFDLIDAAMDKGEPVVLEVA